jgi:hypothetical protein
MMEIIKINQTVLILEKTGINIVSIDRIHIKVKRNNHKGASSRNLEIMFPVTYHSKKKKRGPRGHYAKRFKVPDLHPLFRPYDRTRYE